MITMQIEIDQIIADATTQPRAQMNMLVVNDYATKMSDGAVFPPIVVFRENGNLLLADGFHRKAAAEKAELSSLPADVIDGTLRDAILYSVSANADHGIRRTNADKQRAVKTLLADPEWRQWSDSQIGRQCRVSRQTVDRMRKSNWYISLEQSPSEDDGKRKYKTKHGTTATMDVRKIGKESATEKIEAEALELVQDSLWVDNKPEEMKRLANMDKDKQLAIAEKINEGATSVQSAWKQIEQDKVAEIIADLPDMGERYSLFVSDIANIDQHVEPESIDLIFTDPPYPEKYIPLYETLSLQASRLLKPGALLVAMVGKHHLMEYMVGLAKHLDYHWTGSFIMTQTSKQFDRLVYTQWKPLLIFSKGKYSGKMFNDTIHSPEPSDKTLDKWEQSLPGIELTVSRFCTAGYRVLDPFCGTGTTGAAALKQNAFFIGSDVNQKSIDQTKSRIKGIVSVE